MSVARALATVLALATQSGLTACRSASPTSAAPQGARTAPSSTAGDIHAQPIEIEVHLSNLDPALGAGPVQLALWNSESSFMRSGNWVRGATVAIVDAGKPVVFSDLPPGTYAVSAFHDTQSAGELRQGTFGIPIDPWAVSNGGSHLLPPSWRRAKFTVEQGKVIVQLEFGSATRSTP